MSEDRRDASRAVDRATARVERAIDDLIAALAADDPREWADTCAALARTGEAGVARLAAVLGKTKDLRLQVRIVCLLGAIGADAGAAAALDRFSARAPEPLAGIALNARMRVDVRRHGFDPDDPRGPGGRAA